MTLRKRAAMLLLAPGLMLPAAASASTDAQPTATVPAPTATPAAAAPAPIVKAVPMSSLPSPSISGVVTDHYTQGSDGSTTVVRTGDTEAMAVTAASVDFNYTYDFDSILRGRDMSTTTGQFCNVVDSINPQGTPQAELYLKLFKGGSQVGPTVYIDTPGTGWCWGGEENGTTYHYNYEHDQQYFGFYINGSGHSYG